MRRKGLLVLIALSVGLLFTVGVTHGATLSILGPTDVYPTNQFPDKSSLPFHLDNGRFYFDLLINNITPLANLDYFNITLGIQPTAPGPLAKFASANVNVPKPFTQADPNYVFFGNSDGFQYSVQSGGSQILFADLTRNGAGVTDVAGKLLAHVLVDVSAATLSQSFIVALLGSLSYIGPAAGGAPIEIAMVPYTFQVVPIPGAALLFGSGLLGLIGLRRRIKRS